MVRTGTAPLHPRTAPQRQTLTWVAAGVGAAGAATATWLWIASDDPGRYARYRVEVAAGLAPRDGGLMASLALAY